MSFAGLLDSTVRVWRPTVTLGDLREEIRSFSALPLTYPARLQRPSSRLVTEAGGLAAQGTVTVYLEADCPVLERDVLEVIDGPEAASKLEIDAPPARPRGHHTEVVTRYYLGDLP